MANYNNVSPIIEMSKEAYDSVSEPSEDLHLITKKITEPKPFTDFNPTLYDEGNKSTNAIPMFIGTGRRGWETDKSQIQLSSKDIDKLEQIYSQLWVIKEEIVESRSKSANHNWKSSRKGSKVEEEKSMNSIYTKKKYTKEIESSSGIEAGNNNQLLEKPIAYKETTMIQEIAHIIKKEDNTCRHNSTFSKLSPMGTSIPNKYAKHDLSISKCMSKRCNCADLLIVDDQMINRIILKEFSSKFHVSWEEAENGKVAVQMYKQSLEKYWWNGYKLILMDLNMPVMDGLMATKKILDEKTPFERPKIVAITAFCSEEEKQKWSNIGFDDFRLKPIDLNTFHELMQKFLS
jgi:CheY-like chemotaxis protein